ncbi:MAG: hypothetical protein LBS49_01210 [Candidatus Accumulibacter sp.]|jgi:hypothetical protein|nr:hypothetical protein [Accumulibacter sp.]
MNGTKNTALKTAVHEFAHYLQASLPELDAIFVGLHQRRTAGEALESLKKLTGLNYASNELTRKDKYVGAYFGKEYGYGLSVGDTVKRGQPMEMMSMSLERVLGVDYLANPNTLKDLRKFYIDDREFFDLVVGLLFHWKP